jgi:integrase
MRGINTVRKRLADGSVKTYYYHRATDRRLIGKPNSPEFIAAYSDAEKSLDIRVKDTFVGLVREFTLSIEFQQTLAQSTQTEYRRMLTAAEKEFHDLPIIALNDSGVREDFLDWREKVAHNSGNREADNRLSAISAMLTWATNRGKIASNHLRGFKRLYFADRSEIIWLREHVAAFMAVASIEMQQAMILALHTGQRLSDLLRLPWSAYDGKSITLRQGKARRGRSPGPPVIVPCTAALRRMLDSMERTSPLILTTKTGQSFKKRYFSRLWDETMFAAGLETSTIPGFGESVRLHFHDLRGTTVTLLSESGSNPQMIGSITGHSLKTVHRILERYLARTSGLGEQAISNWENSPRTEFANRLQTNKMRDE